MEYAVTVVFIAVSIGGCSLWGEEDWGPDKINPARLLGKRLPTPRVPSETPYTTFQTHHGYKPEFDIGTGSVIVYSDQADRIKSWAEHGYRPMVMWGPRLSRADVERRGIADEVQTLASGKMLGHSAGAVYLAPGPGVEKWAVEYLKRAAAAGAEIIVPEELEYFSQAGYGGFFKREWQRFHGEPWRDPASSVEARYKAERLKAHLTARFLRRVFAEVKKDHPAVRCFVAEHSPLNYALWGITCPNYEMCSDFRLEGIIAQVWSDTAQTPIRFEGEKRSRTFEHAFLEYSSVANLARGTKRELWFLADPLRDVPGRPIEEYRSNYQQTVVASLMFPGVNRFEVMPWPERIFGSVPDDYAIEITSTVQALNRISMSGPLTLEGGTPGIATFLADSAMWQRGGPNQSNLDGVYGMTLPLLSRGIPVQIAQLECARNPEYLEQYSVLMLSYDFLKPTSPRIHAGLTRWVEDGGVLIFAGGDDPFNAVGEWWNDLGFDAPHLHLLKELGIDPGEMEVIEAELSPDKMRTVLKEEKRITKLENKRIYEVDVSEMKGRHLLISVGDSHPDDGWGAYLTRITLFADGRRVAGFDTFTPQEEKHLLVDGGSRTGTDARFMDGHDRVVYRFERPQAERVTLTIDVGNQFEVKAMASQAPVRLDVLRSEKLDVDGLPSRLPLGPAHPVVVQHAAGVKPFYTLSGGDKAVGWQRKVGKGHLIFLGAESRLFAESPEGAELLRGLVRRACRLAGVSYREKPYLLAKRGRYVAVRTFDRSLKLKGDYIDVFNANLTLRRNPEIKTRSWALLMDVSSRIGGDPALLWSSADIRALNEKRGATAFFAAGPKGTKGVARIWRGKKFFRTVQGCLRNGDMLEVISKADGDSIKLTWPNQPEGAVIRVEWQ